MFTTDFIIDTIQNNKKQFINTFVTHEGMKDALNEYIDNQTACAKSIIKTVNTLNTRLAAEVSRSFIETDVTKFFKFTA